MGAALVVAVATLGYVASATFGLGLSLDPAGQGCRGFMGETVHSVAWSRDGRYVAAASSRSDGTGATRVFEWPSMTMRTRATTDDGGDYAAIADDGTIYWMNWDPSAESEPATTLWRQPPGGEPEALGALPDGRYLSLSWAAGSLTALEFRPPPEASRLVRLNAADLEADPAPLTEWLERAGDEWVDRTGDWMAWIEPNVPSDQPNQIVVRHGGSQHRVTLPGYGGRIPTLTPDHEDAIYQRSETARLTVVDLASGRIRGELDERDYYGGEVSSRGVLAAPTAHGPGQSNELCVLDVTARLTELDQAPDSESTPPSRPAEQVEARDAILAAARRGGAVSLTGLVPGDWNLANTFKAYDDNVTALSVLGMPFDLEGATKSLYGQDGTVFVMTGNTGVVAWFAVPASALRVSFAGGGFARPDATFVSDPGDPPVLRAES